MAGLDRFWNHARNSVVTRILPRVRPNRRGNYRSQVSLLPAALLYEAKLTLLPPLLPAGD